MNIELAIEKWNGKSTDLIAEIYGRYSDSADFIPELIRLMEQLHLQKGTTWLMKKHLESGKQLELNDVARVYNLLPKLEHWEAKLHVLQCLQFMPINSAQKEKVETFIRHCLVNKSKFVKAWAYNGFYQLALQHKEYQIEVKQLLKKAMQEESASVKARVHNILKGGFKIT